MRKLKRILIAYWKNVLVPLSICLLCAGAVLFYLFCLSSFLESLGLVYEASLVVSGIVAFLTVMFIFTAIFELGKSK